MARRPFPEGTEIQATILAHLVISSIIAMCHSILHMTTGDPYTLIAATLSPKMYLCACHIEQWLTYRSV
jgi:hypothetical protein